MEIAKIENREEAIAARKTAQTRIHKWPIAAILAILWTFMLGSEFETNNGEFIINVVFTLLLLLTSGALMYVGALEYLWKLLKWPVNKIRVLFAVVFWGWILAIFFLIGYWAIVLQLSISCPILLLLYERYCLSKIMNETQKYL